MTLILNHMQEALKSVSIRGRMAMATACLENVLDEMQLISPPVAELLDILWRFAEMDDLGEWDEQIGNLTLDITQWHDGRDDLPEDSKFSHLPECILKMIAETIEVGGSNLYAGVEGYSNWTLIPLINVLNLALENGFRIPLIEPFEKSRFSEFHGWGFAVSREIFSEATVENNGLGK